MAGALREELLGIPGIAGAEVEGSPEVAGVKVQLAPDADPDRVGAEVRRILASHGMRSARDPAPDLPRSGPPPPPGVPGSVVRFPRQGRESAAGVAGSPQLLQPRGEPEPSGLESVAVEEAADGFVVRLRGRSGLMAHYTIGRSVGLDRAIVAAVAQLLGREAELVEVFENRVAGTVAMTVVLEGRGSRVAGAAVQAGGRAFAVAQAAWAAYAVLEAGDQ